MTSYSLTVSTALVNLRQRQATQTIGTEISKRAEEVTTGLKADPWADLGARGADAIGLRIAIERAEGFAAQNGVLDGRLAHVESALTGIREAGQGVLDIASGVSGTKAKIAETLKTLAGSAVDSVVRLAGASHLGGYVLAGDRTDSPPLLGWDAPNTAKSEIAAVVGAGPADAADAAAKIAALEDLFDTGFAGTFTPPGTPEPTVWQIAPGETLEQPARADDAAVRDLLRGLAMMSEVDVAQIDDPEAYAVWMGAATEALSSGLEGLRGLSTETGLARQRLDSVRSGQEAEIDFLSAERNAIEGVDQYDAAARLQMLQTQLETSYAVTARLSRLSFLNFL